MAEMLKIKELTTPDKITIAGMDCADCAVKIEKAVQHMPGIISAKVIFPAGKLNFEYDAAITDSDQVIKKVHSLGYQVKEETGGLKTKFTITGLDCADCAAKLEKGINRIPGVETARVNFGTSKMVVTHNAAVTDILTAVEKMGYSGSIETDKSSKQHSPSFWKTNQYAMPTLISMVLLLSGLLSEHLGSTELVYQSLFIAGIVLGGFLPAKNGMLMLINAHELDMNILMSIAVIGAVVIGQYEEAASVVFLFSCGNALQSYTMDKTRNSIRSLMELTPNEALVNRDGVEMLLSVEEIKVGDTIIVKPGERIPMDGHVLSGSSTVNQAPITGESIPVEKQAGDEVYAGTINEKGSLDIKVNRLSKDNTMARIIEMVEEAQGQRAPSQQFVDKFARYYTPLVIITAVLVASIPPLLFNQSASKWFYEALGMLLVACPCALVISTPVSIVSAIGCAARNGVLIKGGAYLEEAGSLSVVAFDKTGTLTEGKPRVTDIIAINGFSEQDILSTAAAIEFRSEHLLANAVVECARERGLSVPIVTKFEAVTGKGAQAAVGGKDYLIGNTKFFSEELINSGTVSTTISELQKMGKTVMLLGDKDKIMGIIAVADILRSNSKSAIQSLKKIGIKRVLMLTGDNEQTARAIAESVGVDEYRADLMPEDKVNTIKNLLNDYGKVAMVGDGVNDAPAMAISTVGIAMGAVGTDAALETADIALMADDLTKLSYAITLGAQTLKIIKQNIGLALIIKTCILLLVIPGWLTLWLAVIGDMGSSLLVTLNGMRLLRFKG